MKYVINHQITFCNESRTISLLNNIENSVVLSAPASRLLLTLIVNNNTPLKREYLLSTVWEEYGFTASGSNLNNYISELRKSLAHLVPEFSGIITIPKIGFQFTANIETFLPQNEQTERLTDFQIPSPITEKNETNILLVDNVKVTDSNYRKKISNKNKFISTMIILPLIIILVYYLFLPSYSAPIESRTLIYSQDNCDIYSLDEFTSMSTDDIVKVIKQRLKIHNINCNSNNLYDIYYSAQPDPNSTLIIQNFMGVCIKYEIKEVGKTYKNCHTFVNEV